jgi:hypothetical protein
MFKKVGIGVGVLIVGFLILVATRPATWEVERSQTIAAEPAVVYALVNDFHKWPSWSPWEGLDPDIETTFSGSELGEGAVYEWKGNDEVGQGKMTIVKSVEPSTVEIDLVFITPMESRADDIFTFEPDGEGTKVTWSMKGDSNFIGKAFSLFMDIDEMVGADFEKGLGQLKGVAEAGES